MAETENIIIGEEYFTKKAYSFIFSGWDNEDARAFLNKLIKNKTISYWRTDMLNMFIIVSDRPIDKIRDAIHEEQEGLTFLLIELENCSGWLPKDAWNLIHKYYGKEKSEPEITME